MCSAQNQNVTTAKCLISLVLWVPSCKALWFFGIDERKPSKHRQETTISLRKMYTKYLGTFWHFCMALGWLLVLLLVAMHPIALIPNLGISPAAAKMHLWPFYGELQATWQCTLVVQWHQVTSQVQTSSKVRNPTKQYPSCCRKQRVDKRLVLIGRDVESENGLLSKNIWKVEKSNTSVCSMHVKKLGKRVRGSPIAQWWHIL